MKKTMLVASLAFCFLWAGSSDISAQDNKSLWTTLAKVTFKKQYDEMLGFKVDVPIFSPEIKALEGKSVEIKGYIIPVEGYRGQKEFVFSAFPYNMCFFCGGAGPETVMEVKAKNPVPFSADVITIRGTLQLNSKDINKLMYALSNVELVK